MAFSLMFPLRITKVVLALVVFILSAYVANWYNVDTLTSSPSQVNFLIFSSLWTFISIAYLMLAPKFLAKFYHPWAAVGIEAINVVFWFAGFVALAVFLSKLLFCRGAVCGAAQAVTVFSAFEFAAWAATAALTIKDVFKSGFRKPSPAAAPQMKETMA